MARSPFRPQTLLQKTCRGHDREGPQGSQLPEFPQQNGQRLPARCGGHGRQGLRHTGRPIYKRTTVERSESRTSLPHGSSQKSIPPPTSPIQGCIVDITREMERLRSNLSHFQTLSHEALMPVLPVIESQCSGLSLAIQQCSQIIEQANACRQSQKNSKTSLS